MIILHEWQNFYILTGTASATLIGLLFIAMSIGGYVPVQQAKEYIRTFVTPLLFLYAQVLFISCLSLMPLENIWLVSGVLALLGVLTLFLTGRMVRRIRVVHGNDSSIEFGWFWYMLLPFLGGLLLIASAVGCFLQESVAAPGIVIIVLLELAVSLRNTWNLMLWLITHRGKFDGQ